MIIGVVEKAQMTDDGRVVRCLRDVGLERVYTNVLIKKIDIAQIGLFNETNS
jgi:hypothetical protein